MSSRVTHLGPSTAFPEALLSSLQRTSVLPVPMEVGVTHPNSTSTWHSLCLASLLIPLAASSPSTTEGSSPASLTNKVSSLITFRAAFHKDLISLL